MGDWTPLGPVVCMVDDVGDSSGGEWYGTDVWVAIGRVRGRGRVRGWRMESERKVEWESGREGWNVRDASNSAIHRLAGPASTGRAATCVAG